MSDHSYAKAEDILHHRVRIRFYDPDGVAECLTTADYRSGMIESVVKVGDREDWILVLDKPVSWPDYSGQLRRKRKFLVHIDCLVDAGDVRQRFLEAKPGERVALVHLLAHPTKEPDQLASMDERQYVTAGTLIIEAKLN